MHLVQLFSIVEEFFIFVLQTATCSVDNILIVNKSVSLVLVTDRSDWGRAGLANIVDDEAVRMALGDACDHVSVGETAHSDTIILVSSLSVPLDIFQSDQRSSFLLRWCHVQHSRSVQFLQNPRIHWLRVDITARNLLGGG